MTSPLLIVGALAFSAALIRMNRQRPSDTVLLPRHPVYDWERRDSWLADDEREAS